MLLLPEADCEEVIDLGPKRSTYPTCRRETYTHPVAEDDTSEHLAVGLGELQKTAVDRWFTKRGLPNLIEGYSATEDVFTRAAPVLLLFWVFGIVGAYGDRFTGWSQAFAAIAGIGFLAAVAALVNWLRGRRYFQVPDHVGFIELGAFVLAPAFLPVIVANSSVSLFLQEIALGIAVLVLIWFWFGFGLGSIIRWAVGNLFRQITNVLTLMMRSLPLLLVFTMFLFLNAELWQVANDFTTPLFLAATGGLIGVSLLFVLFRIPAELHDIGQFATMSEVETHRRRSGAPLEGMVAQPELTPPLTSIDRLNVAILTIFAIGVQIALIMMIVGLFYVAFGLVAVRPTTIEQWTTGGSGSTDTLLDLRLFGADIPLTGELLKVTGFLMAFASLQFTVSALTDSAYRAEFFDELTSEIRDALAVRVVYLDRLGASERVEKR